MLTKKIALDVLNASLETGGDYAEIYYEKTLTQSFRVENGLVESCVKRESFGVGLRILKGLRSVYGYTSDVSRASLLALAHGLAASFIGERLISVEKLIGQKVTSISPINDHLLDVTAEEKISLLKEANNITRGVSPSIVRAISSFSSTLRNVTIYSAENATGTIKQNEEERGRFSFVAFASDGKSLQVSSANPGRSAGWHVFRDEIPWRELAKNTALKAMKFLDAKECPSGRYPVVIGNGWGGVIFHEACGHSLEATSTAKHISVFSDSIGKQIASSIVSAYDDGTLPFHWGSNNIDSEGHKTQKNQLIKDGVCVGFLVDKFNGRRLNMEPNGCSRRESYKYEPTSRMSNTYIASGKDNPEDIIKDTKLGIYVSDFGGGSVNPATGEFNFSASEAYIIRDGKIAEPVKGCTLIGSGSEVLMNIDRVGNDLDSQGTGMCGSLSGSVPVNVGQPTIRVKEITVGGRGGKLE